MSEQLPIPKSQQEIFDDLNDLPDDELERIEDLLVTTAGYLENFTRTGRQEGHVINEIGYNLQVIANLVRGVISQRALDERGKAWAEYHNSQIANAVQGIDTKIAEAAQLQRDIEEENRAKWGDDESDDTPDDLPTDDQTE